MKRRVVLSDVSVKQTLRSCMHVVTAPRETIRLMADIDAAIPKWPIEWRGAKWQFTFQSTPKN
jgi:hypothetical protein